jgi:hypothetical protein
VDGDNVEAGCVELGSQAAYTNVRYIVHVLSLYFCIKSILSYTLVINFRYLNCLIFYCIPRMLLREVIQPKMTRILWLLRQARIREKGLLTVLNQFLIRMLMAALGLHLIKFRNLPLWRLKKWINVFIVFLFSVVSSIVIFYYVSVLIQSNFICFYLFLNLRLRHVI